MCGIVGSLSYEAHALSWEIMTLYNEGNSYAATMRGSNERGSQGRG